jgi:hypothetical protein
MGLAVYAEAYNAHLLDTSKSWSSQAIRMCSLARTCLKWKPIGSDHLMDAFKI